MSTIAERFEQYLREQHHTAVAVAEQDGTLLLSGHVPSEHDRQAIMRAARDLAGSMSVVDLVEVERHVGSRWDDESDEDNTPVDELDEGSVDDLADVSLDDEFEEGVPLDTNAVDAVGDEEYDDEDEPEEDPAYFAPTDPVIGADARGVSQVIGGFEATSLAQVSVDPSAEDGLPGDEALADAVRRELREDASTTDLELDVVVERGVVHLRGTVADLEDAENAEAVASTVPGVRDVIDETDVEGL